MMTTLEMMDKIHQLQVLNAELLIALKHTRQFLSQPTPLSEEIDKLIVKAESPGEVAA